MSLYCQPYEYGMEIKFDKKYGLRCGDYVLKKTDRRIADYINSINNLYLKHGANGIRLSFPVYGTRVLLIVGEGISFIENGNYWDQISEHILKAKVREAVSQNRDIKD